MEADKSVCCLNWPVREAKGVLSTPFPALCWSDLLDLWVNGEGELVGICCYQPRLGRHVWLKVPSQESTEPGSSCLKSSSTHKQSNMKIIESLVGIGQEGK